MPTPTPERHFTRRGVALAPRATAFRHALREYAVFAGAVDAVIPCLELAVAEAMANVVVHAYIEQDQPGDLAVEAWVANPHLVVVVTDNGRGMKPRPDSPGLGAGLPLISAMVDDLELVSGAGYVGVTLIMRFLLDGSGAGARMAD